MEFSIQSAQQHLLGKDYFLWNGMFGVCRFSFFSIMCNEREFNFNCQKGRKWYCNFQIFQNSDSWHKLNLEMWKLFGIYSFWRSFLWKWETEDNTSFDNLIYAECWANERTFNRFVHKLNFNHENLIRKRLVGIKITSSGILHELEIFCIESTVCIISGWISNFQFEIKLTHRETNILSSPLSLPNANHIAIVHTEWDWKGRWLVGLQWIMEMLKFCEVSVKTSKVLEELKLNSRTREKISVEKPGLEKSN